MSAHVQGHQKSPTQWGGLTKTILAGAAIVIGVSIAFPGVAESVMGALESAGSSIAGLLGIETGTVSLTQLSSKAGQEVLEKALGSADQVKEVLGNLATGAAGAAKVTAEKAIELGVPKEALTKLGIETTKKVAAGFGSTLLAKAGGIAVAIAGYLHLTAEEKPAHSHHHRAEQRETFAMAEDIRRHEIREQARYRAATGQQAPAQGRTA